MVQSGFIQVQVVVHPLLCVAVKVSSKQWWQMKFHFVLAFVPQKGGVTLISWCTLKTIHALLTKFAPHCGESGRWYWSCNWGSPLIFGLIFSSVIYIHALIILFLKHFEFVWNYPDWSLIIWWIQRYKAFYFRVRLNAPRREITAVSKDGTKELSIHSPALNH